MDAIIEVTEAGLLPELMTGLYHSGCVTEPVTASACRVVRPHASSARQARIELDFFLRAWQTRHPGVEASVNYLS